MSQILLLATHAARRLAMLLVAASAAPALAQSGTPSAVNALTDTVVITATRSPQRIDQTLADVSVIGRTQLEAAAGRSLPELLAREAGVQFTSNGGLGKTASVYLRGLENRHTLLLIDGVRQVGATVGAPTWESLSPDAIERIEIVRGPLSALYGSDAVGGVIQIFTRKGSQGLKLDASASAGSLGHRDVGAGLRFGQGGLEGSLRLQTLRQDGFSATNEGEPFGSFNADRDGFAQTSAHARLAFQFSGWRAEASLLRNQGTSGFDDGPGTEAKARLVAQVATLSLHGDITQGWNTSLRVSQAQDDVNTLASASPWTELGSFATTSRQLSWENRLATPIGTLLAVLDSNRQSVSKPNDPYAVSQRSLRGIGLGLNGQSGPHGWQANLREDRNSQFGKVRTGTLAYGHDITPSLRASATAGTSFVAPSFNQLYYPGFGNANLQPEEGIHREWSLRWTSGALSSRLAWVDNRIRGFITSGPRPTNLPRFKSEGFSGSLQASLGAWTLAASLDSLTGQPTNRAADAGRLSLDWSGGAWTLGGSWQAQGERRDLFTGADLAGFSTLDLRAEWRVRPGLRLGLNINNALDKPYEMALGYNQPRRTALLALRWEGR